MLLNNTDCHVYNDTEVIDLQKQNNDKSKANQKKKKKDVIDLTSYMDPDIVETDVLGSYTGVPEEQFYDGEDEVPVQDADDL